MLGLDLTNDGAREIAGRARGTPRIAGRLLKRVRDFASVAEHARVDAKIADAALTRLEVDARGLDAFDKRYLQLIAESFGGGPVGIETIAAALGRSARRDRGDRRAVLVAAGLRAAHAARARCHRRGLCASGACRAAARSLADRAFRG